MKKLLLFLILLSNVAFAQIGKQTPERSSRDGFPQLIAQDRYLRAVRSMWIPFTNSTIATLNGTIDSVGNGFQLTSNGRLAASKGGGTGFFYFPNLDEVNSLISSDPKVTSVTSANSDLSISNPTTTPVITVNRGNFILNQTTQQATSNFNISADGVIGDQLAVGGAILSGSKMYLNTGSDATIGLNIQAFSPTQSARLIAVRNSVGGVMWGISATGVMDAISPSLTGIPVSPTASPGTNTTQIATTAFVTAAVTASNQTLSLGSPAGNIVLSGGGGNVSLPSLSLGAGYTGDANSSTLYANAGFYPYFNSSGSTNYPVSSGAGFRIVPVATTTGRLMEGWVNSTSDSTIYFRKGIGSGNYSPFMAMASKSYVGTQLSGYVPNARTLTAGYGINTLGDLSANRTVSADTTSTTGLVSKDRLTAYANSKAQALALFVGINGNQTVNDTKTFTNNVILKGGIIVDNATLAMRDFSGTGFKVSLTPPVTVVGSDKIVNIRDQSGTMALTSDISIQPIAVKSADYTLTVSDYTIVTGTLSTTYTLPAAASVPVGKTFVIKNFSSGSITVATTGTELKWNPASFITPVASLTGTISGWMLQTDGTYWYLITGD